MDVVYYPADRSGPTVDTITLQNNPDLEFTLDTNGGIIELISQSELSTQVFWRSSEQTEWIEITPEAERLHAYELTAGTDVIYSVSHVEKLPTPIRLSLRNADVSCQPSVQWELLDRENQVLSEGLVRVDGSRALFDRIINDARIESVSSPVHRYFAASPKVAAMRIRSLDYSVIVSAYTRPPILPIVRSVPRDYSAFERARVENDTWFLMWPVEASKGLQTKVVSIQSKPPVYDERISSGRFEWTAIDPFAAGPAKEILIPRADHAPVHSGTVSFVYRQIQSGADVRLDVSDPARAPRLLFRAKIVTTANSCFSRWKLG